MSRLVSCVVLKREAPGLSRVPYPGELGQRIFNSVSGEGWKKWIEHQTMIINENVSLSNRLQRPALAGYKFQVLMGESQGFPGILKGISGSENKPEITGTFG